MTQGWFIYSYTIIFIPENISGKTNKQTKNLSLIKLTVPKIDAHTLDPFFYNSTLNQPKTANFTALVTAVTKKIRMKLITYTSGSLSGACVPLGVQTGHLGVPRSWIMGENR